MIVGEQTILVVSDDVTLWTAVRRELETRDYNLRVSVVNTLDAAHRILQSTTPAVILLEESAVKRETLGLPGKEPRLDIVVSSLAIHAPVVVIGPSECEEELAALRAAGVADYVSCSANSLSTALEKVEWRLQKARDWESNPAHCGKVSFNTGDESENEDFGEILRHELNNPLTGILGNAELLLAEIRRKNDGHIPAGGQQRVETIAALAVRMREAVRRLSERWESRQDPVRSE